MNCLMQLKPTRRIVPEVFTHFLFGQSGVWKENDAKRNGADAAQLALHGAFVQAVVPFDQKGVFVNFRHEFSTHGPRGSDP